MMTHYDTILDPIMTQYDAILDPLMMTHDFAMSAIPQINNDESPKKLFPHLRS